MPQRSTNEKAFKSYIQPLVLKNDTKAVERTGAVVKPRTLGREVPGSSPPVAVRYGHEQVTYPHFLR